MKVEVVLPVHNEASILRSQTLKIKQHVLTKNCNNYPITITIVNNSSTDNTADIARKLMLEKIIGKYIYVAEKGRGKALKLAIKQSTADVLFYMDIDLSTDLQHFFPLLDSIMIDHYDIAIGSRLSKESTVIGRRMLREILSRGYNRLVRFLFPGIQIKDMQCGFKAFSHSKASFLLPLIKNNQWFFDTELLLLASKFKLTINQIPVRWKDDPSSSVNILKTVLEDTWGLIRMRLTINSKTTDGIIIQKPAK